jgi:hypothetical protein
MLTRIHGIPCEVELLHVSGQARPAITQAEPDYCAEEEHLEVSFAILDRRGRPADWLEEKLSPAERKRIVRELLAEDERSRA